MTKKPTKAQRQKQELVQATIQTTLAAGAKVLQEQYGFDDMESGLWILATAELLAEHIGTDEARAEIEEAREALKESV